MNLRVVPLSNRLLDVFRVASRNGGTLCVLIVYCVVYAVLIRKGHGIPYVMDNNETFSALNHAYNLWTFDFFKSYGLADEAISPFAAAHPFVHTHQGDFPRLFSFILYAAGARTAESQIWITTFTVGLASVLMMKSFFRRTAGDLFATIAVLMLITDYLLFAQWQVNTYRVWHGFFLFAALLCVHGISEWRRPYWSLATILLYACLLYWELVFAGFVAVTVGAYTLWRYWRRPTLVALAAAAQTVGAVLGLGVLVVQLVLYLGWQDFLTDIRLTYVARNLVTDATIRNVREFYRSRHVVFWENFQSNTHFGIFSFVRSIFADLLQVQTPLLVIFALSLAIAALAADKRLPNASDTKVVDPRFAYVATVILTFPICLLVVAVAFSGNAVLGELPSFGGQKDMLAYLLVSLVVAVIVAVFFRRLAGLISTNGAPTGFRRCTAAAIYLFVMSIFATTQSVLYHQGDSALFEWVTPVSGWAAKLSVLAAVLTGSFVILVGNRAMLGRWYNVPASLLPFFCCGLLGYLFTYKFNAGYLHSGYLYRLCPFFVFHADAFLALAPFVVISASANLAGRTAAFSKIGKVPAAATILVAVGAGAAGLLLCIDWAIVQLRNVALLPPDRFAFVSILKNLSSPNEGIASNTYAVPFGYVAKTWAYMNPEFKNEIIGADDYSPERFDDYLWLADRRANAAYQRPGLFVCFEPPGYNSGLLETADSRQYRINGCTNLAIGAKQVGKNGGPELAVVALDGKDGYWVIYRLDWK